MAISTYQADGKTLWKVYVNIRSKIIPSVREQKLVKGLSSQSAALAEEKRLIKEVSTKVAQTEGHGFLWSEIIERWQDCMNDKSASYEYAPTTIMDHVSTLRRWTASWLDRPASSLTRGDGREVLRQMDVERKSRSFRKNVKHTVNVVYSWAIEERMIREVHSTPMEGVKLSADKTEKVPDILTLEEIRKLLHEAKQLEHPWYPIWATALLTGMRSGEIQALIWSDVDLDSRRITVSKSFNCRMKTVKSTKAGYWRTVPISDELFQLLSELKATTENRKEVLPRFWEWDKGEQARILRKFCIGIGIRPICFHALRACFATQLLAHDIAPARVMKICGWRDLKTMQRYIRLAGIEEHGATQVLKIMPSDLAVMGEVVNLFEFKSKRD